jgi:hypothetical protein
VTRNVTTLITCDNDSKLVSNPIVECFEGNHMHLAVLFMVLFTYYLPSSIMRNATFDEAASNALDVVYAQLYRLLTNLGSAVATVMATLLYATPEAAIALVTVGALWSF